MTVSTAALGGVVGCPWCHHRFRAESAVADSTGGSAGRSDRVPIAAPPTAASSREGGDERRGTPANQPDLASGQSRAAEIANRWRPVDGSQPERALPPPPGIPASQTVEKKKKQSEAGIPGDLGKGRPLQRAAEAEKPPQAHRGKAQGSNSPQPHPASAPCPAPREDSRRETAHPPATGLIPAAAPRSATPAADSTPRKKATMRILSEPAEPTWTLSADGTLPALHLEESEMQNPAGGRRSFNWVFLVVLLCTSMTVSLALVLVEPQSGQLGEVRVQDAARRVLMDEYIPSLNPESPPAEYQVLLREAIRAHNTGNFDRERELYRQLLRLLYAYSDRSPYEGLTGSATRDRKLEEQLRILLRE